ncbi:hypothetical protein BDN71DRAFT_1432117 [Pleurotus eryngii]|uniref:Uncharacterized protein n=1 Tax=Pleurotus eryngii TaxID=5323 RepID=A0A9P5ZTX9_PLEER|nr:hypothetical protein BDN71DRAFT_1432117 [Pleurotus eryngii]
MSAASLCNVREHLTNKIACLNNNKCTLSRSSVSSFLNTTTITQITRYVAWYAPYIDYKAALEAAATISDMRHRDVPCLAHLIIIYLSVEAEGFILSNELAPIEPLDLPANYIQIRRAAVAAAIFCRYVLNWWITSLLLHSLLSCCCALHVMHSVHTAVLNVLN